MPQPANLILEDAAVRITIGNLATGAAPDFTGGTAQSIMGTIRTLRATSSVEKTNVKGGGDLSKRHRFFNHAQTMEIEGFVPSTGFQFAGTAGTFEGKFIKIETKEISSMTAYRQWVGVIETWNAETGSSGSGQIERITLDLNPDSNVA